MEKAESDNPSTKRPGRSLPVLCDRCGRHPEPVGVTGAGAARTAGPCTACEGKRFYYWEPETGFCFTPSGLPLYADDGSGRRVHEVRTRPAIPADEALLTVEDMLRYFGAWAAGGKRRKFRLWYEHGWHCRCWPDGLRGGVVSAHDPDLSRCVEICFGRMTDSFVTDAAGPTD